MPRGSNQARPVGSAALVDVGFLVAQARRDAGLTQAELAQRLGISQPAVAQLERRTSNPRIATLERALRAVGAELVIDARWTDDAADDEERAAARGRRRGGRRGS